MATYDRSQVRLLILLILQTQSQYQAHQETLLKALSAQGFTLSRDNLHIELAWLENTADAIVDRMSGSVHIALLTPAGLEIAQGVVEIPGIDRPLPGQAL
ncbi:MAG: hypothetical protein Q8L79_03265 [Methylobacter sp.]|uniref:VpaChn25_0724 family phage protein n=1 Tax=Methylobacter sp. TaxID=2051955 RepID=UPI0027306E66|nr:hypothetical protein [Methylobacter sp.]MDP1664121.1 hypothetical protein [Methylobacter sp.]